MPGAHNAEVASKKRVSVAKLSRKPKDLATEFKILFKYTPPLTQQQLQQSHYLVEQKPRMQVYYFEGTPYLLPMPWTYYLINYQWVHHSSKYAKNKAYFQASLPTIMMASTQVVDSSSPVYVPTLSNMFKYRPCHTPWYYRNKYPTTRQPMTDYKVVQGTLENFWAQNGNREGREAIMSSWQLLAKKAKAARTKYEKIFKWWAEQDVETILAIEFPTDRVKDAVAGYGNDLKAWDESLRKPAKKATVKKTAAKKKA